MPTVEDLLAKAREAGAAVASAEQSVREAQERYRIAVRRLHVAGIPLRDIAADLRLSHQRVHQLVGGAGGPRRRWKLKQGPQRDLTCSFCGKDGKRVAKLVAGPDVLICDQCIGGSDRFDRVHPQSTLCCSFCGKPRARVGPMFAAANAQMCLECLELASDIIKES